MESALVKERLLRRSSDVVHRQVAGETFLVPIRGRLADMHDLFVLNEVGSFLWERLGDWRAPADLAADIAAAFDVEEVEARGDVESYLGQLVEAGLAEEAVRGAAC